MSWSGKRKTCFATYCCKTDELKSDVERFTTHVQTFLATSQGDYKLSEYRLLIGWNYAGATPCTGLRSLAAKQVCPGSCVRARKAVVVFLQDSGFNSFAFNMIKPSIKYNETKWSSLLARTRGLILYILTWKFDFGPESYRDFRETGP